MCFWSENHSLLFYGAQYLAGNIFPDDIFKRSRRTGREQKKLAEDKINQWLSDIKDSGFEEFLSGGYTMVTLSALLNLVDFADSQISRKAVLIVDGLLERVARHTFKGTVFGPEGRVYRDVIYPFRQGIQALIHYIEPKSPYYQNPWMAAFATTKYKIPSSVLLLLNKEIHESYSSGNAKINLVKTKDYLLSSVESPRKESQDEFIPWHNVCLDEEIDYKSFRYTKSLNERFHGTTYFQPGDYGYQQHMWYGAIDNECVIFTNHPGESNDKGTMRPGYWYGNGVFPAIRQNGNILGVIYDIPESHPIPFTHLFWPEVKFDKVVRKRQWLFGAKGDGYMGIWCNKELIRHNDLLIDCEFRAYGNKTAYLCICSSGKESVSFEKFMDDTDSMPIYFDEKERKLTVSDRLEVKFEKQKERYLGSL